MLFTAALTHWLLCAVVWALPRIGSSQIRHVIINTNLSGYNDAAEQCSRMKGTMATIDTVQYHRMCLLDKNITDNNSPLLQFWIKKYVGTSCSVSVPTQASNISRKDSGLNLGGDMCTYVKIGLDERTLCQELGCSEKLLPSLCEIDVLPENGKAQQCLIVQTTSAKHDGSSSVNDEETSTIQLQMSTFGNVSKSSYLTKSKTLGNVSTMMWVTFGCLLLSLVFIVLAILKFYNRKFLERSKARKLSRSQTNSTSLGSTQLKDSSDDIDYFTLEHNDYSTIDECKSIERNRMQNSCTPLIRDASSGKGPHILSSGAYVATPNEEILIGKDSDIYQCSAEPRVTSDITCITKPLPGHHIPRTPCVISHQVAEQCYKTRFAEVEDDDRLLTRNGKTEQSIHGSSPCTISPMKDDDGYHRVCDVGVYFTLETGLGSVHRNDELKSDSELKLDKHKSSFKQERDVEFIASKELDVFQEREQKKDMDVSEERKEDNDFENNRINVLQSTTKHHYEDNVYHVLEDKDISSSVDQRCETIDTAHPDTFKGYIFATNSSTQGRVYHSVEDLTDQEDEQNMHGLPGRIKSESHIYSTDRKSGQYDLFQRLKRDVGDVNEMIYSTYNKIWK